MPRDYTPKIPKANLQHGEYYYGRCRNATIARWDANAEQFVYERQKFGFKYFETILCPEDDDTFDVFVAERLADIMEIKTELPFMEPSPSLNARNNLRKSK